MCRLCLDSGKTSQTCVGVLLVVLREHFISKEIAPDCRTMTVTVREYIIEGRTEKGLCELAEYSDKDRRYRRNYNGQEFERE